VNYLSDNSDNSSEENFSNSEKLTLAEVRGMVLNLREEMKTLQKIISRISDTQVIRQELCDHDYAIEENYVENEDGERSLVSEYYCTICRKIFT